MRRLETSDYGRMPWANGRGVTTEIARSPRHGEFLWRVSVAEIAADGEFSRFPHCQRLFVIIEGAGVELSHDGARFVVAPLEPHRFAGAAETSCKLSRGAVRALNVITRNGASASVEVLRDSVSSSATLLYVVSGAMEANGMPFSTGETLLNEERGAVEVRMQGKAIVIAVTV